MRDEDISNDYAALELEAQRREKRNRRFQIAVRFVMVLSLLIGLIVPVIVGAHNSSLLKKRSDTPIYMSFSVSGSRSTPEDVKAAASALLEHVAENYKGCTLEFLSYDEGYLALYGIDCGGGRLAFTSNFSTGNFTFKDGFEPNGTYAVIWLMDKNSDGEWTVSRFLLMTAPFANPGTI